MTTTTKTKAQKVLAICADYNGHKNVRFMMDADDDRLDGENYRKVADGTFENGVLTVEALPGVGVSYTVHADWSVTEIHDCSEHAQYVTTDGAIGHGWACSVCGDILQVG